MITLDDFKKLEIRIGQILSAEKVPETDKLLKLSVDMGETTGPRQIISGISAYFPDPQILVGKEIPVVLNIEPRKLRGYESHGMIMAITANDKVVLLEPSEEVPPGSVVK